MAAQLRPHTTVVLAMSADGKIADAARSPARFGSERDRQHLETQVALADGVIFGAGTLRAYGTTMSVRDPALLGDRAQRGQPPQPVQIVVSRRAVFDPQWRFFRQPVPRWLLTEAHQRDRWRSSPDFAEVLGAPLAGADFDWAAIWADFYRRGLSRIAVLGGGELVASLAAADLIDELRLTLCPLLLGGAAAPTPLAGSGFAAAHAPQLQLLSAEVVGDEVFLHYRRRSPEGPARPAS